MKYQVCYDVEFDGKLKTVVCYETDLEYDAQCYITGMHMLGDYSGYYIKRIN